MKEFECSTKIRSKEEYTAYTWDPNLLDWEKALTKMVCSNEGRRLGFPGRCQICNEDVEFVMSTEWMYHPEILNFREIMTCPKCNLYNRARATLEMCLRIIEKDDSVYMYEQLGGFYKRIREYNNNTIGSEFLGEEMWPGSIAENGIRHEDARNLSFADLSFDCIISRDVFEHVSDIKAVLSEAFRVLKIDGKMLVTVPFNFDSVNTSMRAQYGSNGKLIFIKEPEYHGNPLGGGSLVFYDYSWDLLEWIKEAGFKDAYWTPYYCVKTGNIGVNRLWFLIVEK